MPFLMEVERQERQRMDERLLQIARCDTIADAVTRFREMFTDQQNGIERKVSFAGKLVVQMLSVFVIDFCRQHDFAREVYHQSDEMTKCMADFINIIARGPEYAFYLHMEE